MARRWDLVVGVLEKLLAMDPSERTLDRTLASVSQEFVDFPRLQAKGYISEGQETKDLSAVAVRCIERCTGWTGFRAVPFDRRTFAFFSEMKRWDLLELTAQRTLEAIRSGQGCGTRRPAGGVVDSDETIATAREALDLARREQDAQPQ